jgi:hypothetical protein
MKKNNIAGLMQEILKFREQRDLASMSSSKV